MKISFISFLGWLAFLTMGGAMAQGTNVLEVSRDSGVKLTSQSGNSSGSGFLIKDQYVLTCFHVVAALSAQGSSVNWKLYPDLQVTPLIR